jgi:hypothetical protein
MSSKGPIGPTEYLRRFAQSRGIPVAQMQLPQLPLGGLTKKQLRQAIRLASQLVEEEARYKLAMKLDAARGNPWTPDRAKRTIQALRDGASQQIIAAAARRANTGKEEEEFPDQSVAGWWQK